MSNLAQNVAKLARLHLPDEKADATQADLEKVLGYVQQLESVELPDDTEPFFGAIESVNAIRTDEVLPSTDRAKVLENAPDSDGEFYKVPPVFK
jgi:aspartyl-tRNA(Asn)/glutamyl-tRNA(Gln) amidotransferase subunit C